MQRGTTTSFYEADVLGSITSLTASTGFHLTELHIRFVREYYKLVRLADQLLPLHGSRIRYRTQSLLLPR